METHAFHDLYVVFTTVAARPASAPVLNSVSDKSLKERNGHAQTIKNKNSASQETNGHISHQSNLQARSQGTGGASEAAEKNKPVDVQEEINSSVKDLTGVDKKRTPGKSEIIGEVKESVKDTGEKKEPDAKQENANISGKDLTGVDKEVISDTKEQPEEEQQIGEGNGSPGEAETSQQGPIVEVESSSSNEEASTRGEQPIISETSQLEGGNVTREDHQKPEVIAQSYVTSEPEGGGIVAKVTKGDEEQPEVDGDQAVVVVSDASAKSEDNAIGTSAVDSSPHRNDSKVSVSGKDVTMVEKDTNEDQASLSPTKEINEASMSDELEVTMLHKDTGHADSPNKESATQYNANEVHSADRDSPTSMKTSSTCLSGDIVQHSITCADPVSHRTTSQVSLSSTKGMSGVLEQSDGNDNRRSSEGEIHSSNQDLGLSQENDAPSTAKAVKALAISEMAKEESISLDEEDHGIAAWNGSEEKVGDKICTVTADVRIASLEESLGRKSVTLSASVYRFTRKEEDKITPNPGDKIGFVKGEVLSSATDSESSEMLAALSGDLFAVSEESLANGVVATALIDVVSFYSGEKVASITADVSPSDDPEHPSGVITGEVLAGSDNGTYDEPIGSLSGKVVALTVGDQIVGGNDAGE